MTTNIERTEEIMSEWAEVKRYAPEIAQQMANTDPPILMPDLPRPMEVINSDWARFNEHIDVSYGAVRVFFSGDYGEEPETLTPAEAREQAAYLIAAADYAEQEQGNE